MTNFTIHRMAKENRFAPFTRSVVAPWPRPWLRAKSPASHTARLENASPMNDSTQNGTTSRQRWDFPPLPHTHLRLR